MIKTNRTPAAHSSDFVITLMITYRTELHSVLLPLQIKTRKTMLDFPKPTRELKNTARCLDIRSNTALSAVDLRNEEL